MKNRHDDSSSSSRRLLPRPEVLRVGLVAVVFGLLLWARFLLVTGHPRTAIADPVSPPNPAAAADAGGTGGTMNAHANADEPRP